MFSGVNAETSLPYLCLQHPFYLDLMPKPIVEREGEGEGTSLPDNPLQKRILERYWILSKSKFTQFRKQRPRSTIYQYLLIVIQNKQFFSDLTKIYIPYFEHTVSTAVYWEIHLKTIKITTALRIGNNCQIKYFKSNRAMSSN